MVFSESGVLTLENGMMIRDRMDSRRLDEFCNIFDDIRRINTGSGHFHYIIAPYVYLGYSIELKVHYAFDTFLYISFSTLDSNIKKELPISKSHHQRRLFYQNNSFIELISRGLQYIKKTWKAKAEFIFSWGSILSKYDESRAEAICLVRFGKH